MRLIGEREANSEKNLPQQAESKKPDAQQRSERANSPSIVGNNNTVTINMARQPKLEGFREKVEEVSFSFGSGMTDTETVDRPFDRTCHTVPVVPDPVSHPRQAME